LTRRFRPVGPEHLADLLADRLADATAGRTAALRVAVDGPAAAGPLTLATTLVDPLRLRGHDAVVVDARTFWRDASLRLEFGREDADAFATWLDAATLRREVLDAAMPVPAADRGRAAILPALRDPETNRSIRAARRPVSASTVVLVAGELLLGSGLPFDLSVHLAMTPAARRRRTDAAEQWKLPAFDRYDADTAPADVADVVIRLDDPRHPAVG
jgi:hypothetical protein